jgi:hypothetical protein
MRLLVRLTTTALATALLFTLTLTASARTFRISNQSIRSTWRRLEFRGPETTLARCPLTIEGSFHSATIAKVRGALIGYITRATLGVCETGRATILTAGLPWHITYESFRGPLPNITRIRLLLVSMALLAEQLGFRCLIQTTTARPASVEATIGAGGRVEGLVPDPVPQIPAVGGLGGFGCPITEGSFTTEGLDTGTVTLLGTSNSIFITLI